MPVSPYEAGDLENLRDVLSRELLPQSRHLRRFESNAPSSFLGAEVLDEVGVTHPDGYDTAGLGWGSRVFDRRHTEIESITFNPNRPGEVHLKLRDLRGSLLRTSFETGIVREFSDQLMLGNMRASRVPRCWFRSTDAYIEDPANGLVMRARRHTPRGTSRGLLIERRAQNIVFDSAFQTVPNSGVPWVSQILGAGGAITASTAYQIFDKAITPQCYKIDSGTGGNTLLYQSPMGAIPSGGAKLWLSVDHMETSGVALGWRVYNATAGTEFRASDHTWIALGAFGINTFPLSTLPARHSDYVTFPGGVADVLYLIFGFPSQAASKTAYVFHAQLERATGGTSAGWPSSRIVTPISGTAMAVRGSDTYYWGNDSTLRCIPTQGTILWKFVPLWSSANLAALGLTMRLFRISHDASNLVTLFYDGNTGIWTLRRVAAGVTLDVTTTKAMIAETAYTGAYRWAGSQGELTDTYASSSPYFDVIFDGVRTSGSAGDLPTQATLSTFAIGGTEGSQCDGYLQIEVVPYVLSETEVARWLA